MKIDVYLKNNVYTINCGTGAQKIKWLIEAASLKLDENMVFRQDFLNLQDWKMEHSLI